MTSPSPLSTPARGLRGTDVALRLIQLRKTYPDGPGTTTALERISLDMAPGSFTAIMGPSGSGKSTLLNCASGLDVPTSGQVILGDTELTGLSADARTRFRRRHLGFVFQSYNLIDHLTVAENIQLPLQLDGRRPEPQWQQSLLAAVGLAGKEHQLPGQLSGGQAQRVAIARALITRPTVVFADEPTGALDRATGDAVLDVLQGTARRLGQTLVLVTHDPRVAAAADSVLFLADGRFAGELPSPTASSVAARLLQLEG